MRLGQVFSAPLVLPAAALRQCFLPQHLQYARSRRHKAETLLREIIKTEDLATVPAKWYLALSLMQHNAPAEARTLLKSLEPDTIFGGRAKTLLKAF